MFKPGTLVNVLKKSSILTELKRQILIQPYFENRDPDLIFFFKNWIRNPPWFKRKPWRVTSQNTREIVRDVILEILFLLCKQLNSLETNPLSLFSNKDTKFYGRINDFFIYSAARSFRLFCLASKSWIRIQHNSKKTGSGFRNTQIWKKILHCRVRIEIDRIRIQIRPLKKNLSGSDHLIKKLL